MLYPSDGELVHKASTSEPASPHVGIARGRGVASGERSPILIFLPLDGVGEVFSCLARRILENGAGARVNDGDVK